MFKLVIVPVDGSRRSFEAARHGASIAAETDAELEVVQVVTESADRTIVQAALADGIEMLGALPVAARTVVLVGGSVAETLSGYMESIPGSIVVMSSTGRGRAAAVLGSVADELLELSFGPVIVVGPGAQEPRPLAGELVVPVDGSAFAETAVPLAGAWGIALGARPWIVEAVPTAGVPGEDSLPDAPAAVLVTRVARELAAATRHPAEFEVLHGGSPGWAIVDFATAIGAGLIVMSTHGRSGLRRLAAGSVASDVVRHAPCPVVLQRPPRLAEIRSQAATRPAAVVGD